MKSWMEYRPTLEIATLLSQIERFQGNWEKNQRLKPTIINSLTQSTIITSSGASTRIEGAILTDKEVEELLHTGCKISKISSRSEREVAGYIKALTYILDHVDNLEITEKTIREIHQLLAWELLEDQLPAKQRGTYKDIPNNVVERNELTGSEKVWFRTTPPGIQTNTEMRELIENFKQASENNMPPLIKIAIFIVHFLAIHPFRDGNGRLSRLLTTLLLIKEYKWCRYVSHEKFIEDNKESYYVSLRKTQETLILENIVYDHWVNFFLKVVAKQTLFLGEQINSLQNIKIKMNLAGNESKIFSYLVKHDESSSAEILKAIEISKDGLKKLLRRLCEKGAVEKVGSGSGVKYRIKQ